MLNLINEARTSKGLAVFEPDDRLNIAAFLHSKWQSDNQKMSHGEGWFGPAFDTRITNQGYKHSSCAENVAYGTTDVKEAFDMWMGSRGHRENILGNYKHCAVAEVGGYWTAVFASPAGEEN